MAMKKPPILAVVIPLRNERSGLDSLLVSLLDQLPVDGEIIAVDTGSIDGTAMIVSALAASEERLHLVRAPGALPGAARNAGIAATNASVIIQVDGGCMVEPGWIEALYESLRTDQADYVTGAIAPLAAPSRLFGYEYDASPIFFSFMAWSHRSETAIAGGAAVAYRRSIWERCNGQPDWLRATEDVLFARKVRLQKVRHSFVGSPPCSWQAGPRLGDVFRRRIRYVRADLLLPNPGPSTRSCLLRSALILLLCVATMLWMPTLGVLVAVIVLIWLRLFAKTIGRYRQSRVVTGRKLPLVLALPILAFGSAGWIIAEEIGFFAGIFLRITNPAVVRRARQYLQTSTGNPS